MTAVFKHEIRNYFHTMTAYVFGAFLLAFTGMGATLYNLQAAVSNFEFVLSFGSLIFVVTVPVLTMRVIAEEKKQRTDQLLYSLPITTTQVILFNYYSVSLAEHVSSTAAGSMAAMLALVIGLGLLIRYLTKNENMAYGFYFLAVAGLLAVYFVTPEKLEGLLPALMKELSLFDRFSVFVNGVFDVTGIVFYVTFAAFFLFLSVQSLEKRRYN